MTIENEEDLVALRKVGHAVAATLAAMTDAVRPGITTAELDAMGGELLASFGAQSAPKKVYDFPGFTCISVNEAVAHGVPGDQVLQEGDMVNIDVSAELGGFWADNGGTTVVGEPSPLQARLLEATLEARDRALEAIKPGASFNVVGRIFQQQARRARFGQVKNLCSHGIGRSLHQKPREIYGYPRRRERRRFTEGLVVAIEPFLTTGGEYVEEGADGWTLYNTPGSISAQFEHTVVVTSDGVEILTLP